VVSKTTATTDGVDLSAQYIVNNDLAPVMSTSFGLCEAYMSSGENAFYNTLWQQAAAQGITSFVSSGDAGAADCSAASASSGSGLAVNGLSSTPYNVAVGGTQFSDQGGGYWSATNNAYYTSATGYIPEAAWNESGNNGGTGLWSTGGGASSVYAKPAWQVAPGVPQDGKRDLPDVSLTAAGHDGYLVKSQGNLYVMSGTSASAPAFAGLMALIVQKTGQRQGNANPRFYQLGNAQYGAAGTSVFHDTASGNNSVPGVTGYSSVTGYDLATGLGSVDANALVNNWAVPATPLAVTSSPALSNGTVGTSYSSALAATGGSAPYSWTVSAGTLPAGLSLNASTGGVSGTPSAAGVFSFTVRVSDSVGATASQAMSQAVSAAACGNWPVQGGSLGTLFYADFLSAYPASADGDTLKLQALDFGSDFVLDRDIRVTLDGGYDCGYSANAGATGVLGKLKVSNGTVKVAKVRIK
jgi:pseudomonalisin